MNGSISVLNIGKGDIKITFDKNDPIESERAKRIIMDMLRRGYSIFLRDADNKLHKVETFDPETECYIIADGALYAGDQADLRVVDRIKVPAPTVDGKRKSRKGVPMRKANAIGVGPTAGG